LVMKAKIEKAPIISIIQRYQIPLRLIVI